MSKKNRKSVVFAMLFFGLLIMTTSQVSAAEKTKPTEKTFGSKKSVTIQEAETYPKTGEYIWISYKAKADGCLTIQASGVNKKNARGSIALYDEKKARALSAKTIAYHTDGGEDYWCKTSFGVKGKQRYFIRVKAMNPVKISYSFQKIKDVSGAKKAKAYSLKKDKSKTGLFIAGEQKADWYKIKLPKEQKINLSFQIKTKGNFRVTIYSDKYCIGTRTFSYSSGTRKMTLYRYNPKTKKKKGMEKGTYYIKMEKENETSSGVYNLKWK